MENIRLPAWEMRDEGLQPSGWRIFLLPNGCGLCQALPKSECDLFPLTVNNPFPVVVNTGTAYIWLLRHKT